MKIPNSCSALIILKGLGFEPWITAITKVNLKPVAILTLNSLEKFTLIKKECIAKTLLAKAIFMQKSKLKME